MDQIEIIGGNPVSGEIKISGSKNASLPILACSLLTIEPLKLYNVPDLSDVNSMIKLLESLNVESEFNNNVIDLSPKKPNENYASYDLVRKMRASFLVMGPLLARYGNAKVSLPGFMLDIKGIARLAAPTPPKVIAESLIKSLLGLLFSDISIIKT